MQKSRQKEPYVMQKTKQRELYVMQKPKQNKLSRNSGQECRKPVKTWSCFSNEEEKWVSKAMSDKKTKNPPECRKCRKRAQQEDKKTRRQNDKKTMPDLILFQQRGGEVRKQCNVWWEGGSDQGGLSTWGRRQVSFIQGATFLSSTISDRKSYLN